MLSTRAIQSTVRVSARQVRATTPAVGGGLRAYATAADSVKPPVPLFGIDGTYANALVCALMLWGGCGGSVVAHAA